MQDAASKETLLIHKILEKNAIGWWTADSRFHLIVLSDYLQTLFGFPSNRVHIKELIKLIRGDYRERILKKFFQSVEEREHALVFPLIVIGKEIWVELHLLEEEPDEEGGILRNGYVRVVPDPMLASPDRAAAFRENNLIFQLNSISRILLSFLQSPDPNVVVVEILRDILKQFKAGRTYIFEYNYEKGTQTCTYEVVDPNVSKEQDLLTALPVTMNPWWTQQIQAGRSIILSDINNLPPDAADEKYFLEIQDINSLLVVPLFSRNGVWGYAGIDIVEGYHTWDEDEVQWFTSVINIITIILELQRSEQAAIREKQNMQEAYRQIREFEDTFSLVSKYGKIGYCIFDIKSRTGKGVPQWFHNLGEKADTPLEKIIGVYSHVHPEDRRKLRRNLQLLLAGKREHCNLDVRVLSGANRTTWTQINVIRNPLNKLWEREEMICVNYDVTQLKETERKLIEAKEKAESSDRLKSAFLANMSHEIRTPLNAIVGFADLLVDCEDKEERLAYSKIIRKNNDLLLQLISDILDFSKLEAGVLNLSHEEIEIRELCEELLVASRLKNQRADVSILLEDDLPAVSLHTDRNRMLQVLGNLVSNAIKFTREGTVTLGYTATEKHLRFYVKDTGCGIPAEKLATIFDRFVKLDSFAQGSGLGLAICRSLVEQMGGEIGVESKEGEGSYFWFTHPC